MKVIGAGFGRTGTVSLKAALEELGFGPCYHMFDFLGHPEHASFWEAAWRGVGTRGADTITGTSTTNEGADLLAGADVIAGLEGNDTIDSLNGRDVVYADEGDDAVTDNRDNDRVPDVVYGDEGNDTINVRNLGPGGPGTGDEVRCGPGKRDKVFFDRGLDEVAKDCEVRRPG